jgi:acyl-coenzyme A thioesterase 13
MDVKEMLNRGFNRSLAGLDIFHVSTGRVRARLLIDDSVQNSLGRLHGGAVATLIDVVGTFAVMTTDHFHRLGVTTDLHVSFIGAGVAADTVVIDATVVSCGLTLAFVEVMLTSETRGTAIARGQMTTLVAPGSPPAPRSEGPTTS